MVGVIVPIYSMIQIIMEYPVPHWNKVTLVMRAAVSVPVRHNKSAYLAPINRLKLAIHHAVV